jgi:hypothetical protein
MWSYVDNSGKQRGVYSIRFHVPLENMFLHLPVSGIQDCILISVNVPVRSRLINATCAFSINTQLSTDISLINSSVLRNCCGTAASATWNFLMKVTFVSWVQSRYDICNVQEHTSVGFEVLTPVIMQNSLFWVIPPCIPFEANRRFERTYGFHLQGPRLWMPPAVTLVSSILTMFLRNIGWLPMDYIALHPGIQNSSGHIARNKTDQPVAFTSISLRKLTSTRGATCACSVTARFRWDGTGQVGAPAKLQRVRDALRSNLGQDTGYPDYNLSWLSSVSPAKSQDNTSIGWRPLPPKSLPVHDSPSFPPPDAISWSNPQKDELWTCTLPHP